MLVDVFASVPVGTGTGTVPGIGAYTPVSSFEGRDREGPQSTGDLPRLFRFGNRYQILEKLGEGGMGRVYKALDLELDRSVALKIIRSDRTGPDVVKRFKQELVLARKITHKNVVRIYDLGEAEGMKFFTMELIEGKSLSELLREKKTLTPGEALGYARQTLAGLAEAHSQGVVHRDLKPQNIMVDEEDHLRIMDFGIARTADTATLTGTSEIVGTPDYISPEQVKGETAGPPSDLYSFGIILYELLTGAPPFKGDTAISKVVSRIQTKPAPPRAANPDIPPYLERIILKLMEVDPELRYATAAEVLEDIDREQVDRTVVLRLRKFVSRHRARLAAAAVLAMTVLAIWDPNAEAPEALPPPVTVAVLPFRNVTGAPELAWMESGVPEMLVTDLAQSPALRPVLNERIGRILNDLGKRDATRFDEEVIKAVAGTTGADETLYGSFVQAEGRLRFDLTLRSSTTGVRRSIVVDGTDSEVFSLVDALTTRMASLLEVDAGRNDRPVAEVTTTSLRSFQAFHEGLGLLHDGKTQSAIPLFREAIQEDGAFVMAHARLAEAYFHAGRDAEAKESIAKAQELAEGATLPLFETYVIHAIGARIQDDPETAVASYEKLTQLYPDDPDFLFGLASSLETNGRVGDSIENYRRVLTLEPDYGAALLGLGRMLVVAGEPGEAIPRIQEAIESRYFDGDLEAFGMMHSILGMAFKDSGDYAQAAEEFHKSLDYRLEAEDARGIITSLTNLASALRRVGRTAEASDRLNDALDRARVMKNKTMESFALQNLGNLALDAGQLEDAHEYYRESLNIEFERNEHTELAVRLDTIASVLIRRGLLADAAVYLDGSKRHLDQSEDSTEKAFNASLRGSLEQMKGNFDAASAAFYDALHLNQQLDSSTGTVSSMVGLSGVYLQQGRLGEAMRELAAAEEHAPEGSSVIAMARAEIYLATGDAEAAIETLHHGSDVHDSVENEPTERLRRDLLLATARAASEAWPTASKELARVVDGARTLGVADLELRAEIELGRSLVAGGDASKAVALVERVRDDARRNWLRVAEAKAELVLAGAHHASGDHEAAKEHALSSVDLCNTIGARLVLVDAYRLLGRIESDETYTRKADSLMDSLLKEDPSGLGSDLATKTQ